MNRVREFIRIWWAMRQANQEYARIMSMSRHPAGKGKP